MKISQELLIVGVALAQLLFPLVVVVVGTLANLITLVVDVDVDVALKSLHVDHLALALLAYIVVSIVEESLMRF